MNIVAHELSKRFNREWIVHEFSFRFEAGHTYAIVGPNGSGKSTLLQMLTGLVPPSGGTLTFENSLGRVDTDEVYKSLVVATPYMELIDELTLTEMIHFHFSFKQTRGATTTSEIIDRMELTHAKNKLVGNFSSGMRQRLKLGLAFFSQSELLFLDEPTANLDLKSIDWYWANLRPLLGKTLIIIASNLEAEYPTTAQKVEILKYKKGYKM